MSFEPKVLNATDEERAEVFEWIRSLALGGGPNWRKYAIVLEEWARLGAARPEEVPKFALDSQIEITNQERASKEHAEGVIRALLKDRDRIIEQCATVCDEHARTNAKLPYHQAAAKFLARRIRELSASSPLDAQFKEKS